ncbi:MAG: tail fiber domain-containing protein, partial [Alphaproteobacteria bacterium]|nr:tail fiber domain-containing protein [Alphaproteobacteria bacterium]
MLKRMIGASIGTLLFGGTAMAGCTSFPYTLTNGTTADASQVMADFNSVGSCAAPLANPNFTGNVVIGGPGSSGNLVVASTSSSAFMLTNAAGTGSTLKITGNDVVDPAYPSIRSDNSNLVINPNTSGDLYLNLDVGPRNTFMNYNGGNVGIGTITPGYRLTVNGLAAGSAAWINLSDARLKKNIVPISDALSVVTRLRGVRYQWLPGKERTIGKELTLPDDPQIGFVAQEVAAVVPEAVVVPSEGSNGTYGLKEGNLIPLLVEAIKQQQT